MKLKSNELIDTKGGGIFTTTTAIVATLISAFIFGVLDGIVNPQKCN